MRLRSKPRGLRWRLAAWVAGMLVICLAVVFAAVYLSVGAQIRTQIDRDSRSQAAGLAQDLRPGGAHGTPAFVRLARTTLRNRPYRTSSTLLFVVIPGTGVVSNHDEVFGNQRPDPGETTIEQQAENRAGANLVIPHPGLSDASLVDVGPIRLAEQWVGDGAGRSLVAAGEPLDPVRRAQRSVARAFGLTAGPLLLLALLASLLAGSRVSAPLRRLARVARRVDGGEMTPRMHASGAGGVEVQVLAEAFNRMLDRLQEAFIAQRAFVADASHELRTPLTVIRGQLELLAAADAPEPAEVARVQQVVGAEITRIGRLVDDLLLLARAEDAEFLRREPVELSPFVADLWDGLTLTPARRFELVDHTSGGILRADPDRLAQALRNLARNAIEHTDVGNGLVRLEVSSEGAEVALTVQDDGPGIPAEERDRVFERLHRLESDRGRASGGAGLGLAIVRAIAVAHGGSVRVVASPAGDGARVELRLPGFAAAPVPLRSP